MVSKLAVLDAVALTVDLPGQNLVRGQVGTIVEELETLVFEVEFSDDNGETYAIAQISADHLIALHYSPVAA